LSDLPEKRTLDTELNMVFEAGPYPEPIPVPRGDEAECASSPVELAAPNLKNPNGPSIPTKASSRDKPVGVFVFESELAAVMLLVTA